MQKGLSAWYAIAKGSHCSNFRRNPISEYTAWKQYTQQFKHVLERVPRIGCAHWAASDVIAFLERFM